MSSAMSQKNKKPKQFVRDVFTIKNITRMAVFTALAYLLYMPVFEFSLIPAVPFLKVDFSNTFVMIAGFALGAIPAIIVGALKEILHAVTFSQTVGVGELANIIIMLPYIVIPSVMYKRRRKIKTVFISLAIACVSQAAWSIPVNYLLTFPFFLMAYAGASSWAAGMSFYLSVWYWAVLFNFVKTLLVSAAVLLLYKHLQRFFNYIFKDRKKLPIDAANGARTVTPETGAAHAENRSIKTPDDMEELGRKLGAQLNGGEVVLLTGELGAGKTVFCKGIAKGLGITDTVVSPTFTIMNEYRGGRLDFYHFDAYRLTGADEAEAAGLADFIGRKDGVCAVEWWENCPELFDGLDTISVTIEKTGENGDCREVTVKR